MENNSSPKEEPLAKKKFLRKKRARKKRSTHLRPVPTRIPNVECRVRRIAKICTFLDKKNLRSRLTMAAEFYFLESLSRSDTENQRYFSALIEQAEALEKSLQEMSTDCYGLLARNSAFYGEREWRKRLKRDVRKLWLSAKRALTRIPDPKRHRPTNVAFHRYLQSLADIYEAGTKHKFSVVWDDYNGRWTGPFFRFAHVCLRLIRTTKSDLALAKAIQRMKAPSKK